MGTTGVDSNSNSDFCWFGCLPVVLFVEPMVEGKEVNASLRICSVPLIYVW